jgi:hypothetical protein
MARLVLTRSGRPAALPLALVAALAALGCKEQQGTGLDGGAGDADTDSDADTDADTDTDADADTDVDFDAGPDAGPGADLVGMWAELVNVTIIQEVGIPLVPADQWVASRNFYLVALTTDGAGNLTAHERLCALKLKVRACGAEIGNNTSGVSQNFVDHIPILERHVTVASSAPGAPWVSDIVYEVRGANLCDGECDPDTDLECDPLPANDSAEEGVTQTCEAECNGEECDQDEDGQPGMTNTLTGLLNCDTFVTQRWWARLQGEIVDADTIAGAVVDNFSEQTVVAGTGLCDTGSPDTRSEECPMHQYFKMIRLADDATCADVLALTDCDEDSSTCDSNAVLPLDPNDDNEADCPDDGCD